MAISIVRTTSNNFSWSHLIQTYLLIYLVENKFIKLPNNTTLKDMLQLIYFPIATRLPGIETIFDVIYEYRMQQQLIKRGLNSTLDNIFPYPFPNYSLTNPFFLSSYIPLMHSSKLASIPLLATLITHKLQKVQLYCILQEGLDSKLVEESPERILPLLNSSERFFKNSIRCHIKDIDSRKYVIEIISPNLDYAILYKKKLIENNPQVLSKANPKNPLKRKASSLNTFQSSEKENTETHHLAKKEEQQNPIFSKK